MLVIYDDGQSVEWIVSVDSSVVRAHQHSAGARKKGEPAALRWQRRTVRRWAGDNPQLLDVLDAIAVHDGGPGRPRKRPDMLIADKGYAHDSTRAVLRRRGIRHTVPERDDQIARRASIYRASLLLIAAMVWLA